MILEAYDIFGKWKFLYKWFKKYGKNELLVSMYWKLISSDQTNMGGGQGMAFGEEESETTQVTIPKDASIFHS